MSNKPNEPISRESVQMGTEIVPVKENKEIQEFIPTATDVATVLNTHGVLARVTASEIANSGSGIGEFALIAGRLPYVTRDKDLIMIGRIGRIADTTGQAHMEEFWRRTSSGIKRETVDPRALDEISSLFGHPISTRRMEKYFPGASALSNETIMQILGAPTDFEETPRQIMESRTGPVSKIIRIVQIAHQSKQKGREQDREQLMRDRKNKEVALAETLLIVLSNIASGNQEYFESALFNQLKQLFGVNIDLTNLEIITEAHEIACRILGIHCDLEDEGKSGILQTDISDDVYSYSLENMGSEYELFRIGIVEQLLRNKNNLQALQDPNFSNRHFDPVKAARSVLSLQLYFEPETTESKAGVVSVAGRTKRVRNTAKQLVRNTDLSGSDSSYTALLVKLGERDQTAFMQSDWTNPNANHFGVDPTDWSEAERIDFLNGGN